MRHDTTAARRVLVLGNFSGRNVGDIAILANLLASLDAAYPSLEYLVPSLNPALIRRRFGQYGARPVGMAPWHLAVRFVGLPMALAMRQADLVLVTDNILFDRRFHDPLHNYLRTVAPMARWWRARGIPVVVYHGSLGPIETARGRAALQEVLDAGPVAILRDRPSRELIDELRLRAPMLRSGADCALATEPPAPGVMAPLLARLGIAPGEPWLGWNLSAYISRWRGRDGAADATAFARTMAAGLDRVVETRGVRPVLVLTQRMDRRITAAMRDALRSARGVPIIDLTQLDHRAAAGVLGRMELHVGMRTHSLILAAAAGAPVFNINTYPKNHGFMETVRQTAWEADLAGLTAGGLAERVIAAWDEREATRTRLAAAVARERPRAHAGVPVVGELLGLEGVRPPTRGSRGTPPVLGLTAARLS